MQSAANLRPRVTSGQRKPQHIAVLLAMVGFALAMAGPPQEAAAYSFETFGMQGSLDTTASAGVSVRVSARNPELVGVANGGKANTINGDDGNLNYDQWDVTSLNVKVLHELDLSWRNFGFFGRMYYFYDWAIMEFEPEWKSFTESAQRRAGMDIRLLDAYIKGDFDLFGRPVTIRLGNQVLNWGESTFIQNGISIINPVDVSALRVAGAELREALLPVPMVSVSAGITQNLTIEGFYQFYWENTEIEPAGTFFSTTDVFSPGGNRAYLAFGKMPPDGPSDVPPTEVFPPLGAYFPRLEDDEPDHQGQGGVALRYFAPWLNQSEFGFYYINYHSRLPLACIKTGTDPGLNTSPTTIEELLALLQYGLSNGNYAQTGGLFRKFPENLKLVGGSLSTNLPFGVAFQGEVSYHMDQPLQVDDVELSFAGLSPMDGVLNALLPAEFLLEGIDPPIPGPIFAKSQLCNGTPKGFSEIVEGYRRKDYVQPQMTLTKIFGPMLGADQVVALGEVAADWIFDMEDKDELRYDGPGTATSANRDFLITSYPMASSAIDMPGVSTEGFADDFSWGYRLAIRMDYNDVLASVNLKPSVSFSHDVNGTTPGPLGNFVEDRKIVTVTLTAEYLNALRLVTSYTNYFDGGKRNSLNDRDFVSVAASLSF